MTSTIEFNTKVATMGDKQLLIIPTEKHLKLDKNGTYVFVTMKVLKP